MSEEPLVSCVVIFLDAERFVEEAIESIRAQTYEHWELLLVDDGSTDRSSDIARSYGERDPDRIRYLEHPGHQNLGMSAARNLGVAHASGPYIAFLDADDVSLPERFAEQVALLESHPEAALVYGPTLHWYGWTGTAADAQLDNETPLGVRADRVIAAPQLVPLLLDDASTIPASCSILYRRDALQRVGGFDPDVRGMFEDVVVLAKILLREPAYVASRCWSRYRQHDESYCAVAIREQGYKATELNEHERRLLELIQNEIDAVAPSLDALVPLIERELAPYRYPTAPTVLAVDRIETASAELLGWYIDSPQPAEEISTPSIPISGWAIGRDRRAVAVEVCCEARVLVRAPIELRRVDLVPAFPQAQEAGTSGFELSLRLGGMEPLDLVVQVVLEDQVRVPIARIDARRRARDHDAALGAPLVSVVIAGGVTEAGVSETIDSVLLQTYPRVELLAGAQASGTAAAADVSRYPALRFYTPQDSSAHVARNAGLGAAQGEAVVFLDAGERLLPHAIETGVRELRGRPECSMVATAEATSFAPAMFNRFVLDAAGGFQPGETQAGVAARLRARGRVHFHAQHVADVVATLPSRPTIHGRRRGRPQTTGALILMYHRIGEPGTDPWRLAVSPDHFAEHMQVIGDRFEPIPLTRLAGELAAGRASPRGVAVTFDDGYADNLVVARPLLEKHDVPATVFAITEFLGRDHPFWWDELPRLVIQPGSVPSELELHLDGRPMIWKVPEPDLTVKDWHAYRAWRAEQTPPTPRHALFLSLYDSFRRVRDDSREEMLAAVRAWVGLVPHGSDCLPLSADQLVQLDASSLVDVGTHTQTHPPLSTLSVPRQRAEIEGSRRMLEELLGHRVSSFSYPFGDQTTTTRAVVRSNGFDLACGVREQTATVFVDTFELPRIHVDDWSGEELERRLEGLLASQ